MDRTLIDAENCFIGIKGMKAESNEAFYYKIKHGMPRGEQPTYQSERPIRMIAKNVKDMITDPRPREITPTIVCWPMKGHSDNSYHGTQQCIYGELNDELRGQSWFKFLGTT